METLMAAGLQATLWKAADKLRGSMDAAQYKDFVLGLLLLKYVSEGDGAFRVPPAARWDQLAAQASTARAGTAGQQDIGQLIDAAMDAVMAANPPLGGALPRIFSGGGVDQRRLAELVALIGDVRFTADVAFTADGGFTSDPGQHTPPRDVLGEAYEYFLEKFARAEGRRGGEFYTPSSVVRLLVEMLAPYRGRVYDPCCGSGGMFVQAEKFIRAHRGCPDDIAVYGQESNERTWRLGRMNLAIHGITGDLGNRPADTFAHDQHAGMQADYILANPPFNMSDWARDPGDERWRFGVPPRANANFAWLQHIVSKLAANGTAGVILANGSMSSRQSGEGDIRAALLEADLVSCVIALPPLLFRSTTIPACVWFLTRNKGSRPAEFLVIDARALGTLASRTGRILTDPDIALLAGTYRSWCAPDSAREVGLGGYRDVPGFCRSACLEDVRGHDYLLTPGLYVGSPEPAADDGAEPADEKIARLTKELYAALDESARLEQVLRQHLDGPS
jgi:type I restriction-modification system DNA methylase subunit